MFRVRFVPMGIVEETRRRGERLMNVLERAGIPLETVCGRTGKCGRCKVIVIEGKAPITDNDRKFIRRADLDRGMRLACAVKVNSDMVVEIPKESARNEQVILEDANVRSNLRPKIRSIELSVPPPSLAYQVGDHERMLKALAEISRSDYEIPLRILRKLPDLLKSSPQIRLIIRGTEILDIVPIGDSDIYGVAVDIGTTTDVAYLMDLRSGDCVAVQSKMNPQIAHGDDVISRITYAMKNSEGAETLQKQITSCIDELIGDCCARGGVPREKVFEIVVVGNTAMHHLFFGLDTSNLGRSPFIPVVADAIEAKSRELGINAAGEAYVYSLPNVAGFVGADHVAVLLASRLWDGERPRMAIDIGTNGEISVGDATGIASTSCAAGPALEGANIRFGMRATTGAIDHLTISDDYEVSYSTINKGKPRGLCGSAVVDAVSEMFRVGAIGPNGKIRTDLGISRVKTIGGMVQFILATGEESATGDPISFTQKDVSEVQCAKAAMYSGATILMEDRGIKQGDLESILLAGAFGNYISPKSAMGLGIFPEVPLSRVKQIGNAAGSGAKIALLDETSREEARKIARGIRFVELAARPEFQERFFQALYIPHRDQSLFPIVMSNVADVNKMDEQV